MVAYLRKKGAGSVSLVKQSTRDRKTHGRRHIDDRKFVGMYVHDRTSFKPRSEFLSGGSLPNSEVPKEYADEYFQKNAVDETSLARELLERKKRYVRPQPRKGAVQKSGIVSYAQRLLQRLVKKSFNSVYGEDAEKEKALRLTGKAVEYSQLPIVSGSNTHYKQSICYEAFYRSKSKHNTLINTPDI
jgi:hypothetical protein